MKRNMEAMKRKMKRNIEAMKRNMAKKRDMAKKRNMKAIKNKELNSHFFASGFQLSSHPVQVTDPSVPCWHPEASPRVFNCDICCEDKLVKEKYNLDCCSSGNICVSCYGKLQPIDDKICCPFCRDDIGDDERKRKIEEQRKREEEIKNVLEILSSILVSIIIIIVFLNIFMIFLILIPPIISVILIIIMISISGIAIALEYEVHLANYIRYMANNILRIISGICGEDI